MKVASYKRDMLRKFERNYIVNGNIAEEIDESIKRR